jgi:pyruvate dehydrogenase E2 component (dihydrolipoamide acetyltransferase)
MSEPRLPVRETRALNRVTKAMAKGMKASVENLALSEASREIDVTALKSYRAQLLESGVSGLSLNTMLLGATARAVASQPLLNAELIDNQIVIYEPVNLGMAVATPAGLIVVVLREADQLSLAELGKMAADKVERARSGKLQLEDIEGGTFTLSNLGMFGVDRGFPIPRPPESAILLLGAIKPRPVVVDGQIVSRETMWATVTFDHRFIDGAAAAAFLQAFSDLTASPQSWIKVDK